VNAVAFAELGHAVLPLYTVVKGDGGWTCACGKQDCGSPGKHPHARLAPRGLKDASTDIDVIRAWVRECLELNFGVSTDGLVVLDVDGGAGRASLTRLERQHGPLPPTWRVSTGSGGRHIYFKAPRGKDIRNSVGKLAKGLDVRPAVAMSWCPGATTAAATVTRGGWTATQTIMTWLRARRGCSMPRGCQSTTAPDQRVSTVRLSRPCCPKVSAMRS
jgi:hypothetical protein